MSRIRCESGFFLRVILPAQKKEEINKLKQWAVKTMEGIDIVLGKKTLGGKIELLITCQDKFAPPFWTDIKKQVIKILSKD